MTEGTESPSESTGLSNYPITEMAEGHPDALVIVCHLIAIRKYRISEGLGNPGPSVMTDRLSFQRLGIH